MKKLFLILGVGCMLTFMGACTQSEENNETEEETMAKPAYEMLGYANEAEWGEHLVIIGGCDDCHSPKMMTDHGPEVNPDLRLSGNPAGSPDPVVDRAKFEQLGQFAAGGNMTAFVGPWGVSYAANLTPHETGIGSWSREQFFTAIRKGKFHGMENGRDLLPPMPWFNFAKMTDEELNAVFAFLKTLKPIDNLVSSPKPPVSPPPTAMNN